MKRTKVVVEQNEEIVERPVLAHAIVEISKSVKRLFDSGLNERAIVCLIQDVTGVGKGEIRAVIRSLRDLEKDFTVHK